MKASQPLDKQRWIMREAQTLDRKCGLPIITGGNGHSYWFRIVVMVAMVCEANERMNEPCAKLETVKNEC